MRVDRELLARYLRQLRERGEQELYLEELTAEEALGQLTGSKREESAARGSPVAASVSDRGDPAGAQRRGGSDRASVAAERRSTGGANGNGSGQGEELSVLAREAAGCTRCRLHEDRTNVVFGEGSATADVVVVGEAPGKNEDRTGRPFVGRAGKLLDRLLLSAGMPRDEVYICNVIKCRPPKNRDPKPDEVECCSSYLHGQLDLLSPEVLLTVGTFATQMLAGSGDRIGRLRGEVHSYRSMPVVATYHPAYVLRSPRRVRVVWQDFQLLRQVLDEHA